MPGMGTGLSANNPVIVAAFHTALFNQALVVLLIALVVAVAWNVLRWAQLRQAHQGNFAAAGERSPPLHREPAGRRLLRVSFGLIWIFDGILQGQASMPLGMAPQVIQPAAAASPGLGPAPGQRHGDDLELPPRRRPRRRRVDPGGPRACGCWPRPGATWSRLGRAGQCGLGLDRLGVRRSFRAGSSLPASPGCSGRPGRSFSTASPAL